MEWRTITDFPDYEISEMGNVRRITNCHAAKVGRPLKPYSIQGYPAVRLCRDGRTGVRKLHRLVAKAFIGPAPTPAHQVAHNDGNPANSSAANLRWATAKENHADKRAHGTDNKGSRNGRAKLTAEIVANIRRRYKRRHPQDGAAAMAREYGVTDVAILKAITRANWSAF